MNNPEQNINLALRDQSINQLHESKESRELVMDFVYIEGRATRQIVKDRGDVVETRLNDIGKHLDQGQNSIIETLNSHQDGLKVLMYAINIGIGRALKAVSE